MERSKFTDTQIIDALKHVEAGLWDPDVCQELSISSATFYTWCAAYFRVDS